MALTIFGILIGFVFFIIILIAVKEKKE